MARLAVASTHPRPDAWERAHIPVGPAPELSEGTPSSVGGRAGVRRPSSSPAPSPVSEEELNRLTRGEGRPALVTGVNRGAIAVGTTCPEGRAALPQRFGVIRWR